MAPLHTKHSMHPMPLASPPPVALTIAGSDSGGGAGIQVDLKTFQARNVHGTCVITAVTAQNTCGVEAVHHIPLRHIRAQIEAVFADFPVTAVKTGMLGPARAVSLIAKQLARHPHIHLIIDPVMIATSGAQLLDETAITVLRRQLIPLAEVLTPNLPEAEVLTGRSIRNQRDAQAAADELRDMGVHTVLIKGGHGHGRIVYDRLYDDRGSQVFEHPRLPGRAHGTGCTLAAALAAERAKGIPLREACRHAVTYVQDALRQGYRLGHGGLTLLRC